MPITKYRPGGPLARHVESMWYQPGSDAGAAAQMLMLPAGRIDLVIALDGAPPACWASLHTAGGTPEHTAAASLRLLRSTPYVVGAGGRAGTLGISFKAHGLRAFSFCRDALGDHADDALMPALADTWRRSVDPWIERLQAAGTPAAMFRVLEGLLWTTLRSPQAQADRIEHAVGLLSDGLAGHSVASVADAVGMGLRRFQQRFREDTGLTPKTFARVMRLRTVAQWARRHGAGRWTEAAALCHYSDQAHLVREFRLLAGMTPTAYLQLPGSHATCLPWRRAGQAQPQPALQAVT